MSFYNKSRGRAAALFCAALLASSNFVAPTALAQNAPLPLPYRNMALTPQERAHDLVARMSLVEKASQFTHDSPAIPRLGIREYNWWSEGLHGVAAAGEATVFPQAIGMAASFNQPFLQDVASTVGGEFRAKYQDRLHRFGGSDWFKGLTVWSPNVNIFRDPRWGRGQETYGEDPYLTARMGVAFVEGLQGNDPTYLQVVATPKHFAVHSGPEASRHRDNVDVSPHDLEDTYLPAFRATIMEAHAASTMCAYNAINGVPACANTNLLVDHLRNAWHFDGYVVSDCWAVNDIYEEGHHRYTQTPEAGVAAALNAGMDLICGAPEEAQHIVDAVHQGLVTEAVVDRALERLFVARIRLGQFDPAGSAYPQFTPADYDTPANNAMSQRMAEESMVLLKNQNNLLPLRAAPQTIAVIGPNADNVDALVGNYNGTPSHPVTVLAGLKARFPNARIIYAKGTELAEPLLQPVADNALCADAACTQAGLNVQRYTNKEMTRPVGPPAIEANARQTWQNQMNVTGTRWTGFIKAPETGTFHFRYVAKGGYRIWVNGQQLVDGWFTEWGPQYTSGQIDLEAGKTYEIKVETYGREAQGDESLVWSLPSQPAINDAVAAARQADVVIFTGGLSARLEGEEMPLHIDGFEGGDRTKIDLPQVQQNLLEQVTAAGKPVVMVLMNGSAMGVNWAQSHVGAIVEAWYPGGSGGHAVARLIAGDYSPAGRLPLTFYKSVDQLPPFNDYRMEGRTYRYFRGEALYPFGYGLSYTRFTYAPARLATARLAANGRQTINVDVTNAGAMDGDEVVQLYVSRPNVAGSPIRALAGFQRVHLARGETKTVTFNLADRELSTVDAAGNRRIEPGPVNIFVGGGQPIATSSAAAPAGVSANFTITGSLDLPR